MELHVGLDVALESTSVCIVVATGSKVLDTTALSKPEALCIAIRPHVADIGRIGIETHHLDDGPLPPERLETILANVRDRRQERTECRHEHLAELRK